MWIILNLAEFLIFGLYRLVPAVAQKLPSSLQIVNRPEVGMKTGKYCLTLRVDVLAVELSLGTQPLQSDMQFKFETDTQKLTCLGRK